MSINEMLMAAAGSAGGDVNYIDDCFATHLYTGNGTTQTITNDIDLAGKGGLVWIKHRNGASTNALIDTGRGRAFNSQSDTNEAQYTSPSGDDLTSFNANGFSLGPVNQAYINADSANFVSWAFRKQPKFFDVVTYTGTGSARTVAHNLGSVPGMIIVKRTDSTGDWRVYHRANTAAPATDYLVLNTTAATVDLNTIWNDTLPTSTVFSLGTNATVNANGGTYVAYLFAHNAGGFGTAGTDNVISCGSFTYSAGTTVDLGFEPQIILYKASTTTSDWFIADVQRSWTTDGKATWLLANSANGEEGLFDLGIAPTSTGFRVPTGFGTGATFIYMAIRRPMKVPTTGTEVFSVTTGNFSTPYTVTTGFPVDLCYSTRTGGSARHFNDRLRGGTTTSYNYLQTNSTEEELTGTGFGIGFQSNTSIIDNDWVSGQNAVWWNFRRATGFFDQVCYTGTGSARTVAHNLGAVPELMLVKARNGGQSWRVYSSSTGNTSYLQLNLTGGAVVASSVWNDTSPTSTEFTIGDNIGGSGSTYVAYLFASVAGVSKVGSYTGTGAAQTINCGFTSGARFVMIKRTDSTGDWYIYDTARGIVSGNDPFLLANTSAAQTTNTDYIDPASSGFEISSTAPAAINASGGSFIFFAIA
jgi:hypothetical protein